jgi:alkylation response protein AidB-like acyl-CoA dehydrogenase
MPIAREEHMDFSFDPEQVSFKQSVMKFAARELNADAIEREKKGEFYWEGWRKCSDFGIPALPVPTEYGGLGKDIMSCLLAMEGLGYSCKDSGLLFTLASHTLTCEVPISKHGTSRQKEKYLPKMAKGQWIGGHAITEAEAGSDAFSLRTRAVKKGNTYVLNGTKMFISNAPIANILLVFARTGDRKGFAGITGFIVEKTFPGFSVGKSFDKMGLRTAPMGEVVLADCEVPEENRLGQEGQGAFIFNSEMEWERSCLFACHLGAMEAQLESCINYVKVRHQFGSPIGKFQSITNKIADMKVRIEMARLMLYKVAWMKSQGLRAPLEAAIAKLYLSESFVQSSLDAIQIHGGYGYMTEFGIEKYLRDAIAGNIYSGTSEIQRNTIASWLGL